MLLALLFALSPCPPGPRETPVDEAVARGVAYLREQQLENGAWPYRHGREKVRAGNTALALFALLASGVDPDDEAVRRALAQLNRAACEHTYDASCLLLALAAHDPREHRAWIEELAATLIEWQRRDGDWGYPDGVVDLSNTQFAALALRAASLSGIQVPGEVWEELGAAVARYQRSDGAFSYQRGGEARDTMTAAGVGTLALCKAMLARLGEAEDRRVRDWDKRIEKGLFRLAEESEDVLRTSGSEWPYYRLYGIERVGAFTASVRLGQLDWYEHGAAAILASQRPDGSWQFPRRKRQPWTVPQTSFALLFLRRATAAPLSPAGATAEADELAGRFATAQADAPLALAATVDEHLTLWITGWGEAARAHEQRSDRGRGPRVERVAYWAGENLLAEIEGDDAPVDARRFEARVPWPGGEELTVVARATLLTADGDERVELEAPPLTVKFTRSAVARSEAERAERAANLLRDAGLEVTASSTFAGGRGLPEVAYGAELAVDGRLRTPWLAEPGADEPTLTIEPRRAVKADTVLVSAARSVPFQPGWFGRPLQVRVTVNGRDEHVLDFPADERQKARLELPEPVSIRSLELRILEHTDGRGHPCTGIAEVELLRR